MNRRKRLPATPLILRVALSIAWLGILGSLGMTAPAAAQSGSSESGGSKGEQEQVPARILTRSGEIIVGHPSFDRVSIETRYGVLTVPIADVRRLDFAYPIDATYRARLERLLNDFAAASDEDAKDELRYQIVRAGRLSPATLRELRAAAPAARRAPLDEILLDIEESESGGALGQDTVVAARFTIHGKLLLDETEIESRYGALALTRADIDKIAFASGDWESSVDRILVMKSWSDPEQEYKHVYDCIDKRTNLRLVEFSGETAGALKAALRKHRVLLIPELEKAGNSAQVAQEASKALQAFVKTGGIIVSCGGTGNINFLKSGGVLDCSGSSTNSVANLNGRHAILRGVSGAIPYANATFGITVQGKQKMKALATNTNGGIVVGIAKVGAGAVIYCGWDFFQSAEPHQKVLTNAVRWAASHVGGGFDELQ